MRLTEAQLLLLKEAARPDVRRPGTRWDGGSSCVPQYRPAQKLVALGLAAWKDGDPESCRLYATDAGRAAIVIKSNPNAEGGE